VGAFFHAVSVFFTHLAAVRWDALGLALACHIVKLLLRGRAWQNIVRAAYPGSRLRYRSALGAYVAGVGVNSIAPARSGDVVKLYLLKHRLPEATYPTLASTLVVETLFDFVTAGSMMIWALAIGVLPTHQVYSRIPTVDWKFFLRHDEATLIGLVALALAVAIALLVARSRIEAFRARVRLGFAILREPRRFALGVVAPQAISWVLRLGSVYYFLEAFDVRASLHNALLVQVVDSLSTLFPATPGGAGTKQGLIVFVFRGRAVSTALLLAFSVGMNIAIVAVNVVLGALAIALMAHTLSFGSLRRLSAREREQAAP
jgi:glycosyltransferase 2 family protein